MEIREALYLDQRAPHECEITSAIVLKWVPAILALPPQR